MKGPRKLGGTIALHLGDPGKFSLVFFVVFLANTGKNLRENNHGNKYETRKFDAKHSINVLFSFCVQRIFIKNSLTAAVPEKETG